MSNLVPEQRIDKNGVAVKRWVKPSSGIGSATSIPAPRASAPSPLDRQSTVEQLVDFTFIVVDDKVYDLYDDEIPNGEKAALTAHLALASLDSPCLLSLKNALENGTSKISKEIVAQIIYSLGVSYGRVSASDERNIAKLMADQAEMFVTLMDTRFQSMYDYDPMNTFYGVTKHQYQNTIPDVSLSDQTEAALKLAFMFPEHDLYTEPRVIKDMVRDGDRILEHYDAERWDGGLIKERGTIDVDLLTEAGNNHGGIRSGTL